MHILHIICLCYNKEGQCPSLISVSNYWSEIYAEVIESKSYLYIIIIVHGVCVLVTLVLYYGECMLVYKRR